MNASQKDVTAQTSPLCVGRVQTKTTVKTKVDDVLHKAGQTILRDFDSLQDRGTATS